MTRTDMTVKTTADNCVQAIDHDLKKPVVFIHTNDYQLLAAKVSAYSLATRSQHSDKFEIRILRLEETPQLCRRFNQHFSWRGADRTCYLKRDSATFAPLRKMVPQIMGFSGRALVIDPDIFAVADVYELLSRDMQGKAILCQRKTATYEGETRELHSSAVMLLDCAKLRHWNWDKEIDDLFSGKLLMDPWLQLHDEPEGTIELFEREWNHCDVLDSSTKMLHNTDMTTQPWKTGLRFDYGQHVRPARTFREMLGRLKRRLAERDFPPRYQPHPDQNQERFFFRLLKECLDNGVVTKQFVRQEIRKKHLRKDAFAVMERAVR